MNRRGFALLAVLWVVTALAVLTSVALAAARLGFATTRNRIVLSGPPGRGKGASRSCWHGTPSIPTSMAWTPPTSVEGRGAGHRSKTPLRRSM